MRYVTCKSYITGTETKRFQETMSKYLSEESARNRDRVLQVHDFSRSSKSSLHALLSADDEDGLEEEELLATAPSNK